MDNDALVRQRLIQIMEQQLESDGYPGIPYQQSMAPYQWLGGNCGGSYQGSESYRGGALTKEELRQAVMYAKKHPQVSIEHIYGDLREEKCAPEGTRLEVYRNCNPRSHYNKGYGICYKSQKTTPYKNARGAIACGRLTKKEKAHIARLAKLSKIQIKKELAKKTPQAAESRIAVSKFVTNLRKAIKSVGLPYRVSQDDLINQYGEKKGKQFYKFIHAAEEAGIVPHIGKRPKGTRIRRPQPFEEGLSQEERDLYSIEPSTDIESGEIVPRSRRDIVSARRNIREGASLRQIALAKQRLEKEKAKIQQQARQKRQEEATLESTIEEMDALLDQLEAEQEELEQARNETAALPGLVGRLLDPEQLT